MSLQGVLHPLALLLDLERAPLVLVLVEVLEDLVQEASALHCDRSGLLDKARVVVVPVQPRTLEVVVERGRAEVVDFDLVRVATLAVRLERLARRTIGKERDVKAERPSARKDLLGEGGRMG